MKEHEAIKFLLDSGLLFEINRLVLHPFGMALAVKIDDEDNCKFDGLWDCGDKAGMIFDDEVLEAGTQKYHEYLTKEGFEKKNNRYNELGYMYQEQHDDEIIIKRARELKDQLFETKTEVVIEEAKDLKIEPAKKVVEE